MKTQKRNPVKFLRDEAGRSNAWIMTALGGCSEMSITNWYAGKPISRVYRAALDRLVKREETKLAERIIKDAQ